MKNWFLPGKIFTVCSLQISLLTINFFSSPVALAGEDFDFDECVIAILNSGLSQEQASAACTDAIVPEDLGICVEKLTNNTPIPGINAVQNCYLVRRPRDLSACVLDIDKEILQRERKKSEKEASNESSSQSPPEESVAQSSDESLEESSTIIASESLLFALDTCRRSLLPLRHAQCVIDISAEVQDIPPIQIMEMCISAQSPAIIFPKSTDN